MRGLVAGGSYSRPCQVTSRNKGKGDPKTALELLLLVTAVPAFVAPSIVVVKIKAKTKERYTEAESWVSIAIVIVASAVPMRTIVPVTFPAIVVRSYAAAAMVAVDLLGKCRTYRFKATK